MADAHDAVRKLNESFLGGTQILARLDSVDEPFAVSCFSVHLENILCEDDYEDEECLEATKEDITILASEHGSPLKIDVHLDGELKGRVSILCATEEYAKCVISKFNGMIMCGKTIRAWMDKLTPPPSIECSRKRLELRNVLNEEDLEDEDCLEETKRDLLDMMQKFGQVKKETHGKIIGGSKVSASIVSVTDVKNISSSSMSIQEQKVVSNEPLYSGDKIIPEQYAKCKRVPKIPNPGVPREYAKRINDNSVIPLLFDMLGELMRLQLRAKEINNKKAKRRLVLGLREVARGIRAHKVKMVIMANNLDQYGALDIKLEEILKLAHENEIPVIFELNKRKIGKALGKTLKISVVGIENADGAHEPFKKLKRLYETF
jgi:selenocysteine insertion sequence-binding protein 2